MYKREFRTETVEMQDIARAFEKAGLDPVPTSRGVPRDVIAEILRSHPEYARDIENGRLDLVPLDYKEYSNGEDSVKVVDYNIEEPERTVYHDPMVIVEERVLGRTSSIVKEILETQMKIDATTLLLAKGINSKYVRQCLKELAALQGVKSSELYASYINNYLAAWVRTVSSPRLARTQLMKKKAQQNVNTAREIQVGVC